MPLNLSKLFIIAKSERLPLSFEHIKIHITGTIYRMDMHVIYDEADKKIGFQCYLPPDAFDLSTISFYKHYFKPLLLNLLDEITGIPTIVPLTNSEESATCH